MNMDLDEAHDYDCVKDAILKKYDINPETYRQRFRSTDIDTGESPKELYVRLKELYGKWIQPKGKTVGEIIILEQYLQMLSPELLVWIREHDPSTAAEAASLFTTCAAKRVTQNQCAQRILLSSLRCVLCHGKMTVNITAMNP